MSNKKRTAPKSAEQRAAENVIVMWFAIVTVTAAILLGSMHHLGGNVDANASKQAVSIVDEEVGQ